jgi:hypothetical protein
MRKQNCLLIIILFVAMADPACATDETNQVQALGELAGVSNPQSPSNACLWCFQTVSETPLPLEQVLKPGLDGWLAQFSESDDDMDQSAGIYEKARRIATEHPLAQRDVRQVFILDTLRAHLTACRQGVILLTPHVTGGGSAYRHEAAQDGATVEDFLAGFATKLPLPGGKGSAKATTEITAALAVLSQLTVPETGDPETDREAEAAFSVKRAEVVSHWEDLGALIRELPPPEAEEISAFAITSLEGWMDDK